MRPECGESNPSNLLQADPWQLHVRAVHVSTGYRRTIRRFTEPARAFQ